MEKLVKGIHHVTIVTGDIQSTVDFYTGILGLKLIKKTVNFEDSKAYNLFFGTDEGKPGTYVTTLPYTNQLKQGRHGNGKVNTTAFSLDIAGLEYWMERLDNFSIDYKYPQTRFGEEVVIYLEDFDGTGLELIFNNKDVRAGVKNGVVPIEYSIKGLHHVEMWLDNPIKTIALLNSQLGFKILSEATNRMRLGIEDVPGSYIEIVTNMNVLSGWNGRGMVLTLTLDAVDEQALLQIEEGLKTIGVVSSMVKDRKYFKMITFTDANGIKFEIATSLPGLTVDEPLDDLGTSLMLPRNWEDMRSFLSFSLADFSTDMSRFR